MSADKVYGTLKGPASEYVALISEDGHEFVVKREWAILSKTVIDMVNGPGEFGENDKNEINFRGVPSHILRKVCTYFAYNRRYQDSSTEIPEFPVNDNECLELLMAANFLDC